MKKKYTSKGNSVVIPTASAPYCSKIALTNSVGIYLIARIEIAEDIIIVIFLSVPKMSFCFMTVYVIKYTRRRRRSFAKRNSSKLSMLRIVSATNLMTMTITSPKPSANCSMP